MLKVCQNCKGDGDLINCKTGKFHTCACCFGSGHIYFPGLGNSKPKLPITGYISKETSFIDIYRRKKLLLINK
jgi:hypothetical protein